jgi:tetratricopeptide (TPR) repeat protein
VKLVRVLISNGETQEALAQIDKIARTHPDQPIAQLLRGLVWIRQGRVLKAREAFLAARSLAPDSLDPQYYYAVTLLEAGNLRVAESEMVRILEQFPDSEKTLLALSIIYMEERKFRLALTTLNRLLRNHPENRRGQLLRARALERLQDYEEAIDAYEILRESDPHSPLLVLRLADCLVAIDAAGRAVGLLNDYRSRAPMFFPVIEKLIEIHQKNGEFDEALAVCNEALSVGGPADTDLLLLKAEILLQKRAIRKAEAVLRELIRKDPEAVAPLLKMARLKEQSGDLDGAFRFYQGAVETAPRNPAALIALAAACRRRGDSQRAVELYESALNVDPSNARAANDLADLYAGIGGNLDRALALALLAHRKLPERPEVLDTLGRVYRKKGALSLAVQYLEAAVKADPKDPSYKLHLAEVLLDESRFIAARRRILEAMDLKLSTSQEQKADSLLKRISGKMNS